MNSCTLYITCYPVKFEFWFVSLLCWVCSMSELLCCAENGECSRGLSALFLTEIDKLVGIQCLSFFNSPRTWCWWVNSLTVKWSCVILESHATSVKAQTSGIYWVLRIMLVSCFWCWQKYFCTILLSNWSSSEVLLLYLIVCHILKCYRSKWTQHGHDYCCINCHIIVDVSTLCVSETGCYHYQA